MCGIDNLSANVEVWVALPDPGVPKNINTFFIYYSNHIHTIPSGASLLGLILGTPKNLLSSPAATRNRNTALPKIFSAHPDKENNIQRVVTC
mgnify:CR=1 FL=1